MKHVRFEQAAPPRESFFERRDPWGHGISLWVVALLLFLAPVAVFSLRDVQLDNDVEKWLPEGDPSAREFAWCRELFPEQEKLVLTWEGSTLDDPRLPLIIGSLQGQIDADGIRRGGVPYVESAIHGGDVIARMVEHGVDRDEAIRRLQGTVVGRGWIKVQLTEAGLDNREQAKQILISRAQSELGLNLEIHPAVQLWHPREDQEERFHELALKYERSQSDEIAGAAIPLGEHHLQVSWTGMAGNLPRQDQFMKWAEGLKDNSGTPLIARCYSTPGSPVAVVITLSDAGKAEENAALASIRAAAADCFIAPEEQLLGGRVVSGTELNAGVIRAVWNPGAKSLLKKSVIMLSGLVGIIFALISLKSIRLGMLVIGISYYAALLGMAVVPISGGSMNMVLVVMPTLLMVLTLSGAIHVANYWKHAVWEHPETAVTRATQMAGQPCLLAAFTTALGLISLAGSQLTPVRDFGIYASIGTLISVGMVLYGLPALLQMAPLRRVKPEDLDPRFWRKFGTWLCRHSGVATCLSLGISIGCGLGLQHFQVETKVIRYFPEKSQLVKDFQQVEDSLAGICPVEVIVRFSAEAQESYRFLERLEIVRRVEEQIRRHPEVSGTLSLADFQPQREPPSPQASTRDKIFYNRRSNEVEKRVKEGEDSEVASELIAMTRTTPFEDAEARTGVDELWRINAQCAILSDADYNHLTTELAAATTSVTDKLPGVDHLVTGTVPLFLRTQRAVLESLIWSFLMAFGLIALVMIWVLKDVTAGALSMIPNILPVVAIFGLVSWLDQKIDIGTMVTASVALGIAVDGTLHLLTWFRDGLRRGKTREEAVVGALCHCGPAMWQTSAAVGLGLLMLLPADLLLISRFGWLMAALIGAALLGDVVLLPCLLNGALGRLIERGVHRRGEVQPPRAPETPVAIPAPHRVRPGIGTEETRYVS